MMDLSTGANIHETREWIIRNSPVPVRENPCMLCHVPLLAHPDKACWVQGLAYMRAWCASVRTRS
jgi:phosphomethylpyrimidine synthase